VLAGLVACEALGTAALSALAALASAEYVLAAILLTALVITLAEAALAALAAILAPLVEADELLEMALVIGWITSEPLDVWLVLVVLAAADFSELVSLEGESDADSAVLSVVATLVGAVLLVTSDAAALAVLAAVILAAEVGTGILAELAGVVKWVTP
jgi:hypothetical protein